MSSFCGRQRRVHVLLRKVVSISAVIDAPGAAVMRLLRPLLSSPPRVSPLEPMNHESSRVGPHMVTHLGKFMSRLSLSRDRCPNQILVGVSWNGRNHGAEPVVTLGLSPSPSRSLCPFFLCADAHYNLQMVIFLLWLLLASNSFQG